MTKALLIVIMLTANPAADMKITMPLDSLRDCQEIAHLLRRFPQVKFAGCAVKQVKETKTDYRVEQGV